MEKKYKKLVGNTALFAISTFSSKVLSIIIKPLLSYWLNDPSLLGIANLVTISGNLLIPIVGLGFSNAIIRFGLDRANDKKQIFTNGIFAILLGTLLMACLYPALRLLPDVSAYVGWLYLFVPISCLRTLCCQFTRAREMNRLYALDGILCTVTTFFFYWLFFSVLQIGPIGYLLGMVCADFSSVLFLTFTGKLWRFVDFRTPNTKLFKSMLKYALPLVPAAIFWWVTSVSDQYFVSYLLPDGLFQNGLYTQSYVLPTLMTIISTVFTEAWQLSAFTDGTGTGREEFFTRVFKAYQSVIFAAGSGILLVAKLYCRVLSPAYYEAWRYIPMLTIAMVFASLNNFMNSIYMTEKRSGLSFFTMGLGAVVNLALNALLIPYWGVNGAAFATLVCYVVVFIVRVISTRRLIRVSFSWLMMLLNLGLLSLQSFLMAEDNSYVFNIIFFVIIAVINLRGLVSTAMNILHKRGKKA